jgi:hypothetical protein
MTNTDYAIETTGLIKRYPTASRRAEGGYGRGFGGSVSSFGNIFGVVLLPVGYKLLWWGISKSKREGTLGWY